MIRALNVSAKRLATPSAAILNAATLDRPPGPEDDDCQASDSPSCTQSDICNYSDTCSITDQCNNDQCDNDNCAADYCDTDRCHTSDNCVVDTG